MIVVAKIKARKGQEQVVESTLKELVSKVEFEEETLTYILHRSQKDPTTFMVYEKYTGSDAFTHHASTPHFKSTVETLAPLLDSELEIEMYDEIDCIRMK